MFRFWRFGARRPGRMPEKRTTPTQWAAVSLVPGAKCCPAVKRAARRRWLSARAPRFPLTNCNLTHCDCRYQHHADRRAGPRRWSERDALPRPYDGKERRVDRRDRRRPKP